ncbi:MAG: transglycosylase domain-containing protein, partial [Thermacetogeniaceae bacterium]
KGGLKIYTTLDIKAQQAAEAAMKDRSFFPATAYDSQGLLQPQAAVVLLDPDTGAIRAMVGERNHVANRQYNRAFQAHRLPGSAVKPILVYAPAVEYLGMTPDSVVVDEPVSFGSYKPKNYDGRYRGRVTLRDALAYSINVVAVKLLNTVGLERASAFARSLGIEVDPAEDGLAAALGAIHHGVTPLQMAAAYAAFANGGYYVKPYAIIRIVAPDGSVLVEYQPEAHRAMRPETASAIASMLQSAVQYGTGVKAKIDSLAAGKTGTTENSEDIWFCGWVPKMVGVVWMGWDSPRPMPRAYGGDYCARLWRHIMVQALNLRPAPDTASPMPTAPPTFAPKPAPPPEEKPSAPASTPAPERPDNATQQLPMQQGEQLQPSPPSSSSPSTSNSAQEEKINGQKEPQSLTSGYQNTHQSVQ